jgi:hypothetical protein
MNYDDVVNLDPKAFAEEARNWQRAADGIRDRGNDLEQTLKKLDSWTGQAADAAKPKFAAHRQRYADAAAGMSRVPAVLDDAARRLGDVHNRAWVLTREAARHGWRFQADGTVVAEGSGVGSVPMANLDQNAARLQDAIRGVIDETARVDGDVSDALRRLSAEAAGLAPPDQQTTAAAATAIPPRGSAPAEVKKWWDSLSPMQQESLLFTHAAELGALDGIPAVVRDRANRNHLAELKGQVAAEIERLESKPDRTDEENARLDDARKKLHGIEDIEKRINHPDPHKAQQPAFLLGIDTAGNGRAIVAMGNPDTATNVATYVPGTGARLEMVGADMDRADKMLGSAAKAGSPSTSVITWIGYDAPQDLPAAASTNYAEGAKKDLDRFQDGLRATHQGPPSHNTVLGHSYGSTVIGHTARDEGINADELVFVGSPGVGVENASQLNFPTDHVHATVAEHDVIHVANRETHDPTGRRIDEIHNFDPTSPRFGADVFTSDPGTPGPWYTGGYSGEAHSQYWEIRADGTESKSLRNIGRVIVGQPTD